MSLITEEEKIRRQKIVDEANFSVDLEGFKLTPEAKALQDRFINGEIDSKELAVITRAMYGSQPKK